jgi:hypothetical protein
MLCVPPIPFSAIYNALVYSILQDAQRCELAQAIWELPQAAAVVHD